MYVHVALGRCYYFARRYEDAIKQLQAALEMDPHRVTTHFALVRALLQMGLHEPAVAAANEALRVGEHAPLALSLAGTAHALAGRRDDARRLLTDLQRQAEARYVPTSYLAWILFSLDELDAGFEQLETAFRERSGYFAFLRADPRWDPLRRDPRFISLLKRLWLDVSPSTAVT